MKFVVIPLVALLCAVVRVHSMQCYQCSAPTLDDCTSKEIRVKCPAGLNQCGTVGFTHTSGGESTHMFVKGCMQDQICAGHSEICNQGPGFECDIKCCSGDFCNGGGDGEGNPAEALSCHSCSSALSMDDCTEHQKEQQCSPGSNRCGTMIAHKGDMYAYLKACIPENLCSTYCKEGFDPEGRECELSCCEGNLCN